MRTDREDFIAFDRPNLELGTTQNPTLPIRAYLWHGGLGKKRVFGQMERPI